MIYWFTGQPGHGKTTLGNELLGYFQTHNEKTILVDGDQLRDIFKNVNYGKEGRIENIKRAQNIAKFLHYQGYYVVVALVAPYKDLRDEFKTEMQNNLVEIYVHTNVERGRESYFVSDYEPPVSNYIDIDTTEGLSDCYYKLLTQLSSYGNLPRYSRSKTKD
jgi:adenylylsulfate kinase